MKFTIDKNVITLAEVDKAKEMVKEYKTWDLTAEIRNILCLQYEVVFDVLIIDNVEITKDNFTLCLWVDCLVKGSDGNIYQASFNFTEAYECGNFRGGLLLYQYRKECGYLRTASDLSMATV